jgi:hypothetical protein
MLRQFRVHPLRFHRRLRCLCILAQQRRHEPGGLIVQALESARSVPRPRASHEQRERDDGIKLQTTASRSLSGSIFPELTAAAGAARATEILEPDYERTFRAAFKGLPMRRAKILGLKRNAPVLHGNVGTTHNMRHSKCSVWTKRDSCANTPTDREETKVMRSIGFRASAVNKVAESTVGTAF